MGLSCHQVHPLLLMGLAANTAALWVQCAELLRYNDRHGLVALWGW
jgi:hypothetical protein